MSSQPNFQIPSLWHLQDIHSHNIWEYLFLKASLISNEISEIGNYITIWVCCSVFINQTKNTTISQGGQTILLNKNFVIFII